MTGLPAKIVELHDALSSADIPHAFGGALALAWCTARARGTIDIDINAFVSPIQASDVVGALPGPVVVAPRDLATLRRDGQVRLWWDETPLDVFLNTTDFHRAVAARVRWEPFADRDLPFLACSDLAVFKVFFDRTRDWADLEDMASAGTLDGDRVLGTVVRLLEPGDERVARLRRLV